MGNVLLCTPGDDVVKIVVKKRVKGPEKFVRRIIVDRTSITDHAVERFEQRFRLIFNRELFLDGRSRNFLRERFEQATPIDFAIRQKPGLYNMLCVHYGCRMRYSKSGPIIFAWTQDEGKNVKYVLTVLTPGSMVYGGIVL